MYESEIILKRLHQVRSERFFQQGCHSSLRLKVARSDGFACQGVAYNDLCQSLFEFLEISNQAEDRHHFGGNDNIEMVFSWKPVGCAT